MNEQLQQALAAILNKTMAGVEAGASFLQAELPDVIQQLLAWKLAEALCGAAAGALIVCLFLFCLRQLKALTKKEEEGNRISEGAIVITMISTFVTGMAALGGVLLIYFKLKDALQIWIAPKIYLIEYAASLAK
jgi:hypothetical protein